MHKYIIGFIGGIVAAVAAGLAICEVTEQIAIEKDAAKGKEFFACE